MTDIKSIIKKAQDDLFPELEAKIRTELEKKDKDWLIDQIIFLTCEKHSLHEQKRSFDILQKRIARISRTTYDIPLFLRFIDQYQNITREELEAAQFLVNPPHMGLDLIEVYHRTVIGNKLLEKACDILYVTLYGDETVNVHIERSREEVLTIILPESKSDCFSFLKAVTEANAKGTWKDPEGISNDELTNNKKLQIEFRDHKDGIIGTTAMIALKLINLLLVNEQILYTYLENIQRSSLEHTK